MKGWAALFGALGAVTFGFGLLSAVLALFQPAPDLRWVFANLAVGFVLIVVSVLMSLDSLRERMRSGEVQRAGRSGANAVVGTLLSIVILCLLAFLSTRYATRFDFSEQKVNTLSEQSLALLDRLERDVEMTAFFSASEAPPVRDLLERYADRSDRVSLVFADPNRRPDLIEAYGIDPENLARGLVRIAIGDESVEIDRFSESEITNAMLKLQSSEARRILFLEGHNERAIDEERGAEGRGYAQAVAALRNETYVVESVLLAALGEVPEDADLVILAGPTRHLFDEEHAALRRYMARGGAVMAMVDPRAKTDVGETLESWGVILGEDVIFDAKLAVFGQANSPFSGRYAPHPITEKMRDTVIFRMARSVGVAEATETPGALQALVFTGEESWAEVGLDAWAQTGTAKYDAADLLGPVPILVAGHVVASPTPADPAEEEDEEKAEPVVGRLVVIGDSDFASNELIGNYQNRDLFVNAVNWLVDDADQIAIRPPVSRASRFTMSGGDFLTIQLLALFVVPEVIAFAGVIAWWLRRKRPGR